jgi:hypothetical protein
MEDGEVGTEGIVDELLRTGEFRFWFTGLGIRSFGKGGKTCDAYSAVRMRRGR